MYAAAVTGTGTLEPGLYVGLRGTELLDVLLTVKQPTHIDDIDFNRKIGNTYKVGSLMDALPYVKTHLEHAEKVARSAINALADRAPDGVDTAGNDFSF